MKSGGTDERVTLFAAVGVELEYMIVDAETLRVMPIADRVLRDGSGQIESEVEHGQLAWSNELAAHVIELKTNGPAPNLAKLASRFQHAVKKINTILSDSGACLMPGAMHPTMDPQRETVLWPHEYSPVYDAFNRIFDCRGHGWANLQSTHLNLPFANDDEFARLHAAVRLVLPLIPALAASSPIADGARTGWLDYRMEVYRHNAVRVPSVAGTLVPEPAASEAEYGSVILDRIYDDLAPLDPHGILRHEWINARAAIARFDRGTIEIRVTDTQESARADLAIAAAVTAVVRALTELDAVSEQNRMPTERLAELLERMTESAEKTVIRDREYLALLDLADESPLRAHEVWSHLIDRYLRTDPTAAEFLPALDVITREGTLARRILTHLDRTGHEPEQIQAVYRELCRHLAEGSMLHGVP